MRQMFKLMTGILLIGLAVSWPLWAPPTWRWLQALWAPASSSARIQTRHAGLSVQALAELSHLTTLRVEVADVVTTEIHGYTGGSRAVVVVRGDVLLGVDLSQVRIELVDEDHRTATIVLPPPTLLQARVDHDHTRLLGVNSTGLWAITPGSSPADAALLNQAYCQAQASIAQAVDDPVHRQRAMARAASVLVSFGRSAGWEMTVRQ